MDRLEDSLKSIMQVASVIGREFAFRILHAITEVKEDLKSSLLNLQGLEFIYEKNLFPELEYIFRHALTQEVAYNSLLLKRRKQIHERIGQAIEELYPERLEEFYEMLAHHYSKSGNESKAYEYLRQSASKAIQNDAAFEAIRQYKGALGILSKLQQTDHTKQEKIDLVLAMQMPLRRLGFPEDYLALLLEAEALAEAKKRVRVRSELGFYYIAKGSDPQLGWDYLDSCVGYPESIQDVGVLVPVGYDLCTSCLVSGDWKRINRTAPTIIGLIEGSRTQTEFYDRHVNPYSYLLAMWGVTTGACGDFVQGERLIAKALSFAEQINHQATVGLVQFFCGVSLAHKRDGRRAAMYLEKGIKQFEAPQTIIFLGLAWVWLGYAHCLMGDSRTGVDLTDKGLEMHSELGIPLWRSLCHILCSFAHFELGDLEKTRTHADLALRFSLENNERNIQGISRFMLGVALAKADTSHIEEAEQHILQGIALLEELGIVRDYCQGRLYLAELQADAGKRDEALENLIKAESMYRQMGMDYWLGKTREVLARL